MEITAQQLKIIERFSAADSPDKKLELRLGRHSGKHMKAMKLAYWSFDLGVTRVFPPEIIA